MLFLLRSISRNRFCPTNENATLDAKFLDYCCLIDCASRIAAKVERLAASHDSLRRLRSENRRRASEATNVSYGSDPAVPSPRDLPGFHRAVRDIGRSTPFCPKHAKALHRPTIAGSCAFTYHQSWRSRPLRSSARTARVPPPSPVASSRSSTATPSPCSTPTYSNTRSACPGSTHPRNASHSGTARGCTSERWCSAGK